MLSCCTEVLFFCFMTVIMLKAWLYLWKLLGMLYQCYVNNVHRMNAITRRGRPASPIPEGSYLSRIFKLKILQTCYCFLQKPSAVEYLYMDWKEIDHILYIRKFSRVEGVPAKSWRNNHVMLKWRNFLYGFCNTLLSALKNLLYWWHSIFGDDQWLLQSCLFLWFFPYKLTCENFLIYGIS
jgi:hypothetical protein